MKCFIIALIGFLTFSSCSKETILKVEANQNLSENPFRNSNSTSAPTQIELENIVYYDGFGPENMTLKVQFRFNPVGYSDFNIIHYLIIFGNENYDVNTGSGKIYNAFQIEHDENAEIQELFLSHYDEFGFQLDLVKCNVYILPITDGNGILPYTCFYDNVRQVKDYFRFNNANLISVTNPNNLEPPIVIPWNPLEPPQTTPAIPLDPAKKKKKHWWDWIPWDDWFPWWPWQEQTT
ncbi:hypothetical protein [Aureivirga marina]|uniref:hypothetical protein n=1 Tax=Aureivirga marina TaxID=1182451 RepID=UPI0018CB582A|nr:hypothetical protein [Aureivirga marina]